MHSHAGAREREKEKNEKSESRQFYGNKALGGAALFSSPIISMVFCGSFKKMMSFTFEETGLVVLW
jgi:hypothetical protein